MAKIIARISLVPGHSAYFDELSNTYLTWGNPTKNILEGTNVKDLRKSVAAGTIKVIEGSLGHSKTFKQVLMEAKSKRTGEPLKKLMGKSKIVDENGNYADEVVSSVIEKDVEKSVSTIDAGKATTLSKTSVNLQAVTAKNIETNEVVATEESKATVKRTTKKAKKVVVDEKSKVTADEPELADAEEVEEATLQKKATKKVAKKN